MAEFVTEEPETQRRDTVGLAVGIVFAILGLTYLIGGNDAVGDNWGVVVPAVLVLLGVAGLASSGVVRLPSRPSASTAQAADPAEPSEATEAAHPAE